METSPEKIQEARTYFYGEEKHEPQSGASSPIVVPEDPKEIKRRWREVRKELDDVYQKAKQKELDDLRHPSERIGDSGLPLDVLSAHRKYQALTEEKTLLEDALQKHEPPKKNILKKIAAFLSF